MRSAVRSILIAAVLSILLAVPASAAKSPAYKGYCGKQAKKLKGVVRTQHKSAGIYEYTRKNGSKGFWCFSKYKTWSWLAEGKLGFPTKPLYVPGKCMALTTFSSYAGSQVDLQVIPKKRKNGIWPFGSPTWTTFGPSGPGPPNSFNPHNDKAVKSPVFKAVLLDNCVFVVAYRDGGSGLGRIHVMEARERWVPWFEGPLETADMTNQELGSITATPAGEHAVSISWSEAGVPHTEIVADKGVASSF
jgi:hypothetical protein